jgi:hypothetical protein
MNQQPIDPDLIIGQQHRQLVTLARAHDLAMVWLRGLIDGTYRPDQFEITSKGIAMKPPTGQQDDAPAPAPPAPARRRRG